MPNQPYGDANTAATSSRSLAVTVGAAAALLCAGRCVLSTACWYWGPARAQAQAEEAGVALTLCSVSVMPPTSSPLSFRVALAGLRVELEGVIGRLMPRSALGGGELQLGRLELTISPLSGSARLLVRDVQVDVRPLALQEPEGSQTRLRQAQRAAWRQRHLMLDAAMHTKFWRRQAAGRAARRLDDSHDGDSSDDEEGGELDGWDDEGEELGSGVALLRPRRDLDVAPPARRGWLGHLITVAATRYVLSILDHTEVVVKNVSIRVHSTAAATMASDAARGRPEEDTITVRLEELSLGQAPHAADRLADDRAVRDPPTEVPTREETLGRRTAWVRRDPLSPELTLSELPMRSVWMRKARAAVSSTASLSLLKERLDRWFPAAAADRRVGDQQQLPVAASAEGPVSLLPSIHTLSAVGLTVRCERGSDGRPSTVMVQNMLRVDIAACVDECCWMRALDFIVLDAVTITATPLEANASLAPIVRAFAQARTALRYAHNRLLSPPPRQSRRTPGSTSLERRTRSLQLWSFACRCVQEELRRVRPHAAVRWSKLAKLCDYQKQWLHYIAQVSRIGPSGRPMLQLITSLARETLASIAITFHGQHEGNRSGQRVLVSREHADQWAKWVRNRRGHGVTVDGHTSIAAQVTKIVAADLAAVPEPSIRLWARRRHLILATVELVMLEIQPAAIGGGAADGGGYVLSTDEIITVRERALLEHPVDPHNLDWARGASPSGSMSESGDDVVDVAAAMGMWTDLTADCALSLIVRELHVSLHPGPADEAAAAGPDDVAGVFFRIGDVGIATRVTANYDPHEVELAVGTINAVENISIHSSRSRAHTYSVQTQNLITDGSSEMRRDFLCSEVSPQSFLLMRSSLDNETSSAHTAIRVSRLTVEAHLPTMEELARLAERSAVDAFSNRVNASWHLDEYCPLVQPQVNTAADSSIASTLSYATIRAAEWMSAVMVATPSMLSRGERASSSNCEWLMPATDQAGVYLLQSCCCSHNIEIDIDGPTLSITQADATTAPRLTVWTGMVEASYTTDGTPSGDAFRGGSAEAETARDAFSDALPRTCALCVKQSQETTQVRAQQYEHEHEVDRTHMHVGGHGLLFGNLDVCWSGFLASLSHALDGVPTIIRFNQDFKWRAHLSSCVLPRQFSALCGVPVTALRCNLERLDFVAAPPDLVHAHGLLDRTSRALQALFERFGPVVTQETLSFCESLYGHAKLGEHEIPDDMTLQRADAAEQIQNADGMAAAGLVPKADIPGPYRKPRSNRPSYAVRWDGSKGDWLDDDGNVALPPPLDDSEFCTDLMYNLAASCGSAGSGGAVGRAGAHTYGPGHRLVGDGELMVDQPILEVVLVPQPITFTLQQNRGRPLLRVALDWDNVHISRLGNGIDRRASALDICADMTVRAHFDNAHLAKWEPVVEPWRSKVRLQVSSERFLFNLCSERCLDINMSPAFLQGLWLSTINPSTVRITPSKPFDRAEVVATTPIRHDVATAKAHLEAQKAQLKTQGRNRSREAPSDLDGSPYWLRNSCGSMIKVRLRAGRGESDPGYLPVANHERVALDTADYGAPALEVTTGGVQLEDKGGCDLHVRFEHEDEEIEYVFEDVNRVDTHRPKGELAGRPDLLCYVHLTPEGKKFCEVCSRLRIHNRTRVPLEFGFSESATVVLVNEGESGYAPPQCSSAAVDSVFVRPNSDFEWAEMYLAGQEVHRGVARCERVRSGGGQHQQRRQRSEDEENEGEDLYSSGFTACFSSALPDEQCPLNVLALFDALTLQNMIPSTVNLEVFGSAGERAAEARVTLDFGESFVVPNWLPTQPAWLAVTDCRGAISRRTLIHEAEVDKSWAKFGKTPQCELGHIGATKRKVGALKMTANVESHLELRGGAFAVKHVMNGKLTSTDHFDVAIDHSDLVDAGHTVTLHVSHCVINRTEYPLYLKTDSKKSFVVVPAWTPSGSTSTPQQSPIMLPCARPAKSQSASSVGGSSHMDVNVCFGCPLQQVSLEESSHRFKLLGAAFKRDADAFGNDDPSSYAKVFWDSRVIAETEEVRSTRFPAWNKSMAINLSGRAAPMTVAVYDKRKLVSDTLLGEALISIEELRSRTDEEIILPLFTPAGRRQVEAAEAKRLRTRGGQGHENVQSSMTGVWRSTSTDQRITEHILLQEGRKGELTGCHVCGTGDAFVIHEGKHDHGSNEVSFEQVYEQDGARIDWVGTLTSPDTMVGTWHGTGIHDTFDAVRLKELDYADLAVGFLTLQLQDVGEVGPNATEPTRQHDAVHHFVGKWSNELPLSHDLAVGVGLPPITIDAGRQGKRQLGIYVEPPLMPLAPMIVAIVPRFVFYNHAGVDLMLVDVDSTWMATIEPGEHCEGFTAPRQAQTIRDDIPHRLVVRKLRSAGVFVDSEIIDVEEPGVKWGIFPSRTDAQAADADRQDRADVLTQLADDIHAHCQLDEQGTMVITLRKAADVAPPYHIINLSMVELEYRPKLEFLNEAEAEVEAPRYRMLKANTIAALHEHLWPRNRSQTSAGEKMHKLEVRIGGDNGEVRVFLLDRHNDLCPKWEVQTGAVGAGTTTLRPQVLVDRQGLSLRFSTIRIGSRWIDPHTSKFDVQMLGGVSLSIISAHQSRGLRQTHVQQQRQELMYGRLHGIRYTSYISDGLHTVELIVAKLQLDDQISQQVVLRPRLSSTNRQLHFCMLRTSPSTIDRVDLSILPLVLTLKHPTVKRLFLWCRNIFDDSTDSLYSHPMHTAHGRVQTQVQAERVLWQLTDPTYKACVPFTSSPGWKTATARCTAVGNDPDEADLHSRSSRYHSYSLLLQPIYVKSLRLRHIKLECTIDMVGAGRDPIVSKLLPSMVGTGSNLATKVVSAIASQANSVNRMRLNIDAFERSHWFDTSDSAFTTVRNHYSEQTMRQLFSLRGLASLDIFGAPLTKAKIVSESAREGWLAVRDRDGIGVALSGVNMGKELVASTLNTASTMTQTFSGMVKNKIGDEVATDSLAKTSATGTGAGVSGAMDGMSQGGKMLGDGLVDAVTGVLDKPIEGLRQDGGAGLVRGTGQGLLGLVLKPVAAISDFVSASTEGLAQTLDSNPLTDDAPPWAQRTGTGSGMHAGTTMRSARSFGQFGELTEFSRGDVLLNKLGERGRPSALKGGDMRSARHQPDMTIGQDDKCIEMLVETTALQRHDNSQVSVTVTATLLTEQSLVQIDAGDPAVAQALWPQPNPQFPCATVISEAELNELIHRSRKGQWKIVEDCSLQEVFSATFNATDQTVTLLLAPKWDILPANHDGDQAQGRELRLSCGPRIVKDRKDLDATAGSLGGVRDLLGFMDCVVKAASQQQKQAHILVDLTNDAAATPSFPPAEVASPLRASSPSRNIDGTRWPPRHNEPQQEILQQETVSAEHGWLLVIYLTQLDHDYLLRHQHRGQQQASSDWRYSLEVYNVQEGVIGSATALAGAGSAAIELQGHHEDCRLRVRRYFVAGMSTSFVKQAQERSTAIVLDADLPRVGVGAAWRREWCIEDLNGVSVHRMRSAPEHLGGGVSCLSAEAGYSHQGHGQLGSNASRSDSLVDLIVDASMEHRLLHWSIPARVAANAAKQSARYAGGRQNAQDYRSRGDIGASTFMRTSGDTRRSATARTPRSKYATRLLTPVPETSRGHVIDLTGSDEEAEAEARLVEMVDAATEGDVETLSKLIHQDSSMLHARLPVSRGNSGSVTSTPRALGADVSAGTGTATAVWLAACKGHAEAVRWLLQRGADGSSSYHCSSQPATEGSGRTALHVACMGGHSAVVRALLCDPRVILTSRADRGRTAAHCAAERGHMECLRLILHEGRRRGPPAPSVAAAMAMRAPLCAEEAERVGRHSVSVREALDLWFYHWSGSAGAEDVAEKATERDFLLCWVDAQNPQGISADE